MKNKIQLILTQIFCTYIGWLGIVSVAFIIFGALSQYSTILQNGYEWCNYAFWASATAIFIMCFIWIGFGIRNLFKNK